MSTVSRALSFTASPLHSQKPRGFFTPSDIDPRGTAKVCGQKRAPRSPFRLFSAFSKKKKKREKEKGHHTGRGKTASAGSPPLPSPPQAHAPACPPEPLPAPELPVPIALFPSARKDSTLTQSPARCLSASLCISLQHLPPGPSLAC